MGFAKSAVHMNKGDADLQPTNTFCHLAEKGAVPSSYHRKPWQGKKVPQTIKTKGHICIKMVIIGAMRDRDFNQEKFGMEIFLVVFREAKKALSAQF